MRFSLLTLVGLVTLVALEMVSLKNPSTTWQSIAGYVVYACVLASTWGAFCLSSRRQLFCKGFAVLSWASVLYNVFVREDFASVHTSPLSILLAEFLEHPFKIADLYQSGPGYNVERFFFFKIWNLWSSLNSGLLGGFLAMQIRNPKSLPAQDDQKIVGKDSKEIEPTQVSSSIFEVK